MLAHRGAGLAQGCLRIRGPRIGQHEMLDFDRVPKQLPPLVAADLDGRAWRC